MIVSVYLNTDRDYYKKLISRSRSANSAVDRAFNLEKQKQMQKTSNRVYSVSNPASVRTIYISVKNARSLNKFRGNQLETIPVKNDSRKITLERILAKARRISRYLDTIFFSFWCLQLKLVCDYISHFIWYRDIRSRYKCSYKKVRYIYMGARRGGQGGAQAPPPLLESNKNFSNHPDFRPSLTKLHSMYWMCVFVFKHYCISVFFL